MSLARWLARNSMMRKSARPPTTNGSSRMMASICSRFPPTARMMPPSRGIFLVSGRKIPRDGGIILAVGGNREQMEAIIREDPFVVGGLADFRIIEFRASQRANDIQKRIE